MEIHCNALLRLFFLLVPVPSPSLADKTLTAETLASFGFFSHLAGPQPFSSLSLIRRHRRVWVYFSNTDNLGGGGGLFEFLIPLLDQRLTFSSPPARQQVEQRQTKVKFL